jgi:hypothetical protein
MTRRKKTNLERAIDVIDRDIAQAESQLAVLHATRARLVAQQDVERPPETPRGHPEGGKGI